MSETFEFTPEKSGPSKKRPRKITDEELRRHFGVPEDETPEIPEGKDQPEKKKYRRSSQQETPAFPPFDLTKAMFTDHAIEQFTKRRKQLHHGETIRDPDRTAMKILAHAKETGAINTAHKVKRLITHDFKEVKYFTSNDGWRFVIKEEEEKIIIITIERSKN